MNQSSLFSSGARCTVTMRGGALVIRTPYDPGMVAAIKGLPPSDRRFDPTDKTWMVDPKHAHTVEGWILLYFGETVIMPASQKVQAKTEMKILEVHYLGACKDRGDGGSEAFGCDPRTNWLYIFPESVLRGWFDGTEETTPHQPDEVKTLYQILGIPKGAPQDEIKAGYRRMAMQWHPDRCREPNAHEVFLRVQEAYGVLSDTRKKARYDAGLEFEASLAHTPLPQNSWTSMATGYRAPLRCGQILCEGTEGMGRFRVSKILAWQDITDPYGRTLVSSWPMGAKEPTKVWA